jgi:acetyltransferase
MSLILAGRPSKGFRETALFRPASVVLLADPSLAEARVIARNLLAGGFQGRLMGEGVEGFAPPREGVELGILALPPARLAAGMARLAGLGCRVAVVPVAAPGLAALAAAHGVRVLGARSFGVAIPSIGLNATLAHRPIPDGTLGLMAQSSAVTRAVLDWAIGEGLGFSHILGIGANDDIGFALGLDWLSRDARTACVMLELRRIKSRRHFVSAARAAARIRPVLALRPGEMAEGVGAVTDAVLRRAGVLHVQGFEEWVAAAETLARTRAKSGIGAGDCVAVVANGLGPARLAADALLAAGMHLAELSEASRQALGLLLPGGVTPRNPLSLGPEAGTRLAEAAAALAMAPEVDTVLALHAPAPETDAAATLMALRAAGQANRGAPILLGWLGELPEPEPRLPIFPTPEAAVRGARHLAQERRNRAAASELPTSEVLKIAPDRAAVSRIFAAAREAGRDVLREDEALAVLAAYGIGTAACRVVATPADAAAAASLLGFPVVLKVLGLGLRHKSDQGGVALGLEGPGDVLRSARAMRERFAPPLFLVQRQARLGAIELRVRVADDPMFGPWIGFGQGGTAADLAGDEAFDLPPLNLPLAHALIARTRLARLLPGWRERPPVAEPAIADALVRVSQLVIEQPEIAELVVNPLMADGLGVLGVDASIRLRAPGEMSDFSILPYPAHLAGEFRGKDGRVWQVRPIRPEDAESQGRFFHRLPPEDVRFRFFSTMRDLPPAMLARLTQIDYGREMALIAQREGETHGTVRVIRAPGEEAEFAIIVTPEAKGSGLARHLMERAIAWAREQGIAGIVGHVLADNQPMLGFVKRLGFEVTRDPEDAEVMLARMRLG